MAATHIDFHGPNEQNLDHHVLYVVHFSSVFLAKIKKRRKKCQKTQKVEFFLKTLCVTPA